MPNLRLAAFPVRRALLLVLAFAVISAAAGVGAVRAQTLTTYEPLTTAQTLLAAGFLDDEIPGISLISVESTETHWDELYNIQAMGDAGFVDYHIYSSAALAQDNPVYNLGFSVDVDAYPSQPAAIIMSDGWDDFAFACSAVANVLVCGSSSPSLLSLSGYDPSLAEGAAMVALEDGLRHFFRVMN